MTSKDWRDVKAMIMAFLFGLGMGFCLASGLYQIFVTR